MLYLISQKMSGYYQNPHHSEIRHNAIRETDIYYFLNRDACSYADGKRWVTSIRIHAVVRISCRLFVVNHNSDILVSVELTFLITFLLIKLANHCFSTLSK